MWVNGRLTAVDEPSITALDHGVTVGDGAFETAKVDRGQVFAATRHARRLDRTLAGLGLPAADHDYIAEGAKAVLEAGDADRVRPAALLGDRGSGPARVGPGRQPAHLHRDRRRPAAPAGERVGRRRAVDAQRAVRRGRPQDHVVCRERRRPRLRQGARGDRGGLRQHPRRAVRVHRLQHLRRRRRRDPDAAARLGLPGRHHPRGDHRVVPRGRAWRCGRRPCRWTCCARRTRCSSPAAPRTCWPSTASTTARWSRDR